MAESKCIECGMITMSMAEFHPFASCELYKALHSSKQVRDNIMFVVEYGMKAQKLGLTVDEAMFDISKVK